MTEISALDLKGFVIKAICEVFDTMLSMNLDIVEEDQASKLNGDKIVGSVSFAGKASGNINIQVSGDFAKTMTATMLGMDISEVISDEEIHDVIGETSNMIGGKLKSRLCDSGLPCELSIPSITSGGSFKIESKDWMRHEKIVLTNNNHVVLVEAYVKPGV
jgi:chemotaxis protein CheX